MADASGSDKEVRRKKRRRAQKMRLQDHFERTTNRTHLAAAGYNQRLQTLCKKPTANLVWRFSLDDALEPGLPWCEGCVAQATQNYLVAKGRGGRGRNAYWARRSS